MTNKVTIYIDGKAYQVDEDNNLLAGVLANRLNLPYFCWHPKLGSVGACRQCAVTVYQDENDQRGRIAMACTTPVTDGMRISMDDKSSSEFREQIIAAMMTNHPHDCPVCAEGGECHLQDMTVMTKHTQRKYTGKKRTFNNQYLGELVGHEMNRCITCYRCVRFYQDYAGGSDFGCFGSKNQVYFGRQQEGMLESEFSGNLIEICPTGVFTNKPFSGHYARKWDLKSSPSICGFCSAGCNTTIGERYGSVRRVLNRYNERLNGYFLCDRGRFGLQFVNNKSRIKTAKLLKKFYQQPVAPLTIAKVFSHFRNKNWLGIGSGRASVEANTLLKSIVGAEHFNTGWSKEHIAMARVHQSAMNVAHIPTLSEVEQADWIFIVGEDIQQSHPRFALSVRQALRQKEAELAQQMGVPKWQEGAVNVIGQQRKLPLYSLQFSPTKLDDVCCNNLICKPSRMNDLMAYFASILPTGEGEGKYVPSKKLSDAENAYLAELITSFLQAKSPLFISGWGIGNADLMQSFVDIISAADVRKSNGDDKFGVHQLILAPNANDTGLLHLLDKHSCPLERQLDKVNYDGIIVLENELAFLPDTERKLLTQDSRTLIVLEHTRSMVSEIADVVLPVSPVSEYDGHFANYRAELQRFYTAVAPRNNIQPSWFWLCVLSEFCGEQPFGAVPETLKQLHDLARESIPAWPFKQVIDVETNLVAQETHRVSGRTAKQANVNVHEAQTPTGVNVFHPSMEGKGSYGELSQPFVWSPGWNANQSALLFASQASPQPETLDFHNVEQDELATTSENEVYQFNGIAAVYNMAQWQKMEWQSSQTLDLAIRAGVFVLYIPVDDFQSHWRKGQWLKLIVQRVGTEEELSVPVQIVPEQRLAAGHYCSQVEWLCPASWYQFISLTDLNEGELEVFKSTLTEQMTKLKAQQQEVLAKLKSDDQFIPIHFSQGEQRD